MIMDEHKPLVLVVSERSDGIEQELSADSSFNWQFLGGFSEAYYFLFSHQDTYPYAILIDSEPHFSQAIQLAQRIREHQLTSRLICVLCRPHCVPNDLTSCCPLIRHHELHAKDIVDLVVCSKENISLEDKTLTIKEPEFLPYKTQEQNAACIHSDDKMRNLYQLMVDGAGEGFIGLDKDGNITFANPKAAHILGAKKDYLIGLSFKTFAMDSPHNHAASAGSINSEVDSVGRVSRCIINRPDDQLLYIEYTQTCVKTPGERTASILVMEDISKRIKFEMKLRKLAHLDSLTGLSNRFSFEKTLTKELSSLRREQAPLCVVLLDLDGFKIINDTYGHSAGDHLLKMVAERLGGCVRREDLIGRLGGDEFVLLLKDCDLLQAKQVAQKAVDSISVPFTVKGNTVSISCCAGIADVKTGDESSVDVIDRADSAMYRVKLKSKNGICVFSDDETESDLLEEKLKNSINSEQLDVIFQPRFHYKSKEIVAVEAFVRLNNSNADSISTKTLLTIAKRANLAKTVDRIVVDKAFTCMKEWQPHLLNKQEFRLSVNLDCQWLDDRDLPLFLNDMCDTYHINPQMVEVDFPENAFLHLTPIAKELLIRLNAMRMHIALGNFGAAYAPMNLLVSSPVDTIKIDRVLSASIEKNEASRLLVEAIATTSRNLGMRVTAECVENDMQAILLHKLGCSELQGHFFCKPVRGETITKMLH